jgi:hypothetical protein
MITRKRIATVLALTLAAPSFADVTIEQTMNGKALGFSGETTGTTYIKGNKMRSDADIRNRTQTTIFDLDAQKMYVFDSKKKEADVWDMAAFAAELEKTVDMSGAQASFRPNGQTKQIAGHIAAGYDLEISTQAGMDPRAAKAQPGQAKALAEMYGQIAEAGGIAYETDTQITMSGSGPMAAILARMGGARFSTVVDSVETGALSDDLFVPPADYKLNPKQ